MVTWTIEGTLSVEDFLIPNSEIDEDEPVEHEYTVELQNAQQFLELQGVKLPPNKIKQLVRTGLETVIRPLPFVGIEMFAKNSVGAWQSWGKTGTSESGRFKLEVDKSDKPRKIRITAEFRNEYLAVNYADGLNFKSPKYIIYESESKEGPELDYNRFTFTRPGPLSTNGDRLGGWHALIWYIIMTIITFLRRQDEEFAFKKRIHVSFPGFSPSGDPWAEATTRTAHITGDTFNLITIIHEVMHLWDYDHNKGVTNWLCGVWLDGTTQGAMEKPNIAFHEGFAEYAAWELIHLIWGREKGLPNSRGWMIDMGGLYGFGGMERNWNGVRSALRLLTAEKPAMLDLGDSLDASMRITPSGTGATTYSQFADIIPELIPIPTKNLSSTTKKVFNSITKASSCPKCQLMSFNDVLRVFLPNPNAGWPTFLEVGNEEYGLERFLDRAADIIPTFSDQTKEFVKELIDTESFVQPYDNCEVLNCQNENQSSGLPPKTGNKKDVPEHKDRINLRKKNIGILKGKKIIISHRERKIRKTSRKS